MPLMSRFIFTPCDFDQDYNKYHNKPAVIFPMCFPYCLISFASYRSTFRCFSTR